MHFYITQQHHIMGSSLALFNGWFTYQPTKKEQLQILYMQQQKYVTIVVEIVCVKLCLSLSIVYFSCSLFLFADFLGTDRARSSPHLQCSPSAASIFLFCFSTVLSRPDNYMYSVKLIYCLGSTRKESSSGDDHVWPCRILKLGKYKIVHVCGQYQYFVASCSSVS